MVLTKDSIHFLASKKKIEFLRQVEASKDENSVPPVKLHTRDKVQQHLQHFLLIWLMNWPVSAQVCPSPDTLLFAKAIGEHRYEYATIATVRSYHWVTGF